MTEGIGEARFTQEGDRAVNIESARNMLALVPEIAKRLEDHRGETLLQGVTEDGLFIGVKKGTTENKIIAVVTAVLTGSPQMVKQSIDATVFPGTEEQFFTKFAGMTGVDYRPDGSLRRIPSDDFMDFPIIHLAKMLKKEMLLYSLFETLLKGQVEVFILLLRIKRENSLLFLQQEEKLYIQYN